MQYRILGKTGLKISEIGYGGWGIGDFGFWGKSDEEESRRALRRAFELGVNFFDTARVYGDKLNGRSERLIGQLVREVGRDKIYIASKVPPKNWQWPALPGVPIDEVFPNDWIIKNVHNSLKTLGIETLDLMQFHVWQDTFVQSDGWKETIEKLTRQGKVRFWGLSLNDYQPQNCRRTVETGLLATVQLIFNIFHQKPVAMLPFYKKHKLGVIGRVPLDEGGLVLKEGEEPTFPPGDFRHRYFRAERLPALKKRVTALHRLLGVEAASLAELALRYLLSFDEVSTVIPGMRKVAHVERNAAVADGRHLSSPLLEELRKHAWERNFYR